MYILFVDETNRIRYVEKPEHVAEEGGIELEAFPEDFDLETIDLSQYRYADGAFIYDPLPVPEEDETPTQLDRLEAQLAYTAMMTDTLLEV